jgi:hypothetical protein
MRKRRFNSNDGFRMLSRRFEKANTYPRGSEQRLFFLEQALFLQQREVSLKIECSPLGLTPEQR